MGLGGASENRRACRKNGKSAVREWRPFEETYKTRAGSKCKRGPIPSRRIGLHWHAAEVGELTAGVVISELEREKCRAQVAIRRLGSQAVKTGRSGCTASAEKR